MKIKILTQQSDLLVYYVRYASTGREVIKTRGMWVCNDFGETPIVHIESQEFERTNFFNKIIIPFEMWK